MPPFIIVADVRTGSTLLASSLDRHPQIRCYGELFHSEDLPDNSVEGLDRSRAAAKTILARALRGPSGVVHGFKAMAFLPLPEVKRWRDAWERFREVPGLRVLWLSRRDRLAQYASLEMARHTGLFHPDDGDELYRPANRPTITIDPADFRAWVEQRDVLVRLRREALDALPALEVTYETLIADWVVSTSRIQEFLGVDVQPMAQVKRKQERRPLAEVIVNYDELVRIRHTSL